MESFILGHFYSTTIVIFFIIILFSIWQIRKILIIFGGEVDRLNEKIDQIDEKDDYKH